MASSGVFIIACKHRRRPNVATAYWKNTVSNFVASIQWVDSEFKSAKMVAACSIQIDTFDTYHCSR